MKQLLLLLVTTGLMGCSPQLVPVSYRHALELPPSEGNPYAPPPLHPSVIVAPTVNNLPMYINAGGVGGSVGLLTPGNSSISTQWLVRATGGGAGAIRGKGGGGAGGTVVIGLTNLPAGTLLDMVIGTRGLGSDTIGSGGISRNGGDTTLSINGNQIIFAMGGLSPFFSTGGGPGGDPTFNDYATNFVVTYTGHAIAGGDGASWDGVQGIGGSSFWGGGNFGGSGGADGSGGGSTLYYGFSGSSGVIELTRVSN